MVEPPTADRLGPVGQDALRSERIPWEQRSELGIARAFVRTLMLSVREPTRFYGLVPRDGSPLPAILYGLVFEVVIAVTTFTYQKAVGDAELQETLVRYAPELRKAMPRAPELIDQIMRASALGSLFMAPVSYLFELLVTAGVAWIGLRLTKSLRTSFGALVRLLAYATWVRIFGLLGVTGDTILSTLSFLLTLGLGGYYWLVVVRESQQIDTKRAVYASLCGTLVAVVFGCVVGVPPLIALIAWAISKVDLPTFSP